MRTVIAILSALISTDQNGKRFEYRAEMSYAVYRKNSDYREAEKYIAQAIQLRDQAGHRGWRYFELRRARYNILLDPNKYNSDSDTAAKILSDLRVAYTDRERWPKWLAEEEHIREWLRANHLTDDLQTKE